MPCYSPLQAYLGALRPNGKRKIVFKEEDREFGSEFSLPCGRCIGCRLERSRQWAIRLMHEAQLHDVNSFVTLTYSDDNLPSDGSLNVRHFQLFMKKLRKRFGNGIRYFHCGEYSPEKRRPHYHACIFGVRFPDRDYLKMSKSGFPIYTSEICDELWNRGFCFIGDVSFESAAYVARYIVDKVVGEKAFQHYTNHELFEETGVMLQPEYVTMSRRPGIAKVWFDLFSSDVFPSDDVIVRGKQMKPPKYYDSKLLELNPDMLEEVKVKRELNGLKYAGDQTRERLVVREKVRLAKLNLFKRK